MLYVVYFPLVNLVRYIGYRYLLNVMIFELYERIKYDGTLVTIVSRSNYVVSDLSWL